MPENEDNTLQLYLRSAMRDKRFVAEHRGGNLTKEQHHQLIEWAGKCSEHVLSLFGENIDVRLQTAIVIARSWRKGSFSVADARRASLNAIAVANESADPVAIAVARSVGHAVAAAHMADHSLRAAEYALKAVKNAGKPTEPERVWQDEHLPPGIMELVLSARAKRETP